MKFGKFVLKIFIAILPFLILNHLYILSEFGELSLSGQNKISQYKKVPEKIQLANTGASHGGAFNYKNYSELATFNFSLPSQPLIYDYHILNQYKNRFAENSVLLVLVSYNSVFGMPTDTLISDLSPRYYRFLKPKNIEKWNFLNAVRCKIFPIITTPNQLQKIKSSLKGYFNRKSGGEKPDRSLLEFSPEELESTSQLTVSAWESLFPNKGEEGYKYNRQIINEIVKICSEKKIRPVFITTPIPERTNEIFGEQGFFEDFEKFKKNIYQDWINSGKNGDDFLWLDYSQNEEFSKNLRYFKDGNHVTKEAALIFTDKVIADLKALNVLNF